MNRNALNASTIERMQKEAKARAKTALRERNLVCASKPEKICFALPKQFLSRKPDSQLFFYWFAPCIKINQI
jgi:hypothetical protein